MPYRIAVATTDGVSVDVHFGRASSFLVIGINEDGSLASKEERIVPNIDHCSSKSCGQGNGSGGDCVDKHKSCGGPSDPTIDAKVTLLSDCRSLLCKRIGPSAERAFERKAITTFQVDCTINEALEKIVDYYTKVDNHISLRKSR
ncbi:MAG TPA: NifB/NifX family molybdenum-iron cluster-binding protein [Lachnospiraceae bacterium]|nr:NifB/NifX family molybdenum-iron cluster-binding protein [Lachnospiraceae bacterium]